MEITKGTETRDERFDGFLEGYFGTSCLLILGKFIVDILWPPWLVISEY